MAITNITVGNNPGFLLTDSSLEQDIHKLNEITTGQFRLSTDKITDLEQFVGQITHFRFYCRKEWHGRTIHFSNKLNAAGLLFRGAIRDSSLDWTLNDNCPDAFNVYGDDTSLMGCTYDSFSSVERPSSVNNANRLYNHLIYNNQHPFHILLLYKDRFECDDLHTHAGFKLAGVWLYFVR